MGIREELHEEMETTRQNFHHLVDSVPEALYVHPSANRHWTIGDALFHITLGPPALRFEIWMIRHAPGLFQLVMNYPVSKLFNRINALFARQGKRVTRPMLIKAYENGHAGLVSSLKRTGEDDFEKSITYPAEFVSELAGEVTVERLFRYVKLHFDLHAEQIHKMIGKTQ